MRKNLAERQAKMKKRLVDARETFRNCAFHDICCEEKGPVDPDTCNRCSATTLEQMIRRSRSSG
jgi:hypothetical protein